MFEDMKELHASNLNWRVLVGHVKLFHYLPPWWSHTRVFAYCYKAYYGREPEDLEDIWLMVWRARSYNLLPLYVERWLLKGAERPQKPVAEAAVLTTA